MNSGCHVLTLFAHRNRAGRVKIAPAARDSPADPIVCTMLLSRMEFFRIITRITPMARTAAGIDAEDSHTYAKTQVRVCCAEHYRQDNTHYNRSH